MCVYDIADVFVPSDSVHYGGSSADSISTTTITHYQTLHVSRAGGGTAAARSPCTAPAERLFVFTFSLFFFLLFSDPHHHHHQLIDLMMTVMLYEDCPFQLAQSAFVSLFVSLSLSLSLSLSVSLSLYLFCKWWYSTLCNQFSIISFSNRECWLAS